ncbi:glycosyltransferase family 4 protein [Candidatus Peregrinibacteria bacterium]|nr:glycosyltransferase family 4 protein [Candidatus Peregrinibacteria bacterium]
MQILMFGWEFPPMNSGGLGVACQGIVEGLSHHGHEIFLVLPKVSESMHACKPDNLNLLAAHKSGGHIECMEIPSSLYSPYCTIESYTKWIEECIGEEPENMYGKNLFEEIHRYASRGAMYAGKVPHDIIHTHDWLTAEAGIQAKKISDKPMVMHVHATEFDRSGDNVNQQVYDMERRGMEHADRIIAVSEFTKKMLIKHYGIKEWKIDVVHNAVKPNFSTYHKTHHLNKTDKIVLFLGRMTLQKGPDYFLKMAKRVLEVMTKVKFIMAGDGDMTEQMIHMANDLGIERNVLFAGFLKGDEVAQAYSHADLYVMPSVSEPFGIAPLEAIQNGTPVLISKQAGVNEIIKNALRADFWDIDDMANKVIAALQYDSLTNTLKDHGKRELEQISWQKQAKHIENVYKRITGK